jgi:S-adenosylmethionine:tRNA ribosyltransferase-isomerase
MRIETFDFDLPQELIAQKPAEPRDSARLLEVGERLGDHLVSALPQLLRPGDIMVFNDTRVIPARLRGRRGEANVEVTLHKQESPTAWAAFARPAKRLKPGDIIAFAEDFAATVVEKREGGEIVLSFPTSGPAFFEALDKHGEMPLPPYIRRKEGGDARDRQDYQTIFAQHKGAVAAPTASLHFTERLLEAIHAHGIQRVTVTLHVGAGTFLPVKVEDVRQHPMHAEAGVISEAAAATVNEARAQGGRVVAVGTTALRLLETAADESGQLHPFAGETDIYILPGYRFRIVDLLMTNFHLPRSTLFMLVCAFCGTTRMHAAYTHAKREGYRFYSYGDACLLHRRDEDNGRSSG